MIFLPNLIPITNIYSAYATCSQIVIGLYFSYIVNYFMVIVPQLYDCINISVISREHIRGKNMI